MKGTWQTNTLGNALAILRNGVNCKQGKDGNGEKISRIESISDATFNQERVGYAELTLAEKERYRLLPGDILFSHINSAIHVGKTAIFDSDEPIYHGVNLLLMRPKPEIAPAYLNYALKLLFQSGYWKRTCKQSVNQASVNQQDISRAEISYPTSLYEQHRIVAILDAAFDGIATAKANAEQNLQNARALFESHLQAVFTERGEGWVEKSIGDFCVLKSGTSVSVSLEKTEGDLPYVKVSDMTYAGNETEIVDSSRYLDMADVGKNAVFPTGTTIFPKRGGAILTNKKRLTTLPICADLNIMGVIPPSNLLPRLLYFYFLNVDMRLIGSGSSIPQINNYDIAPLKISFSEIQEEQEKVAAQLESLAEETQRLESLYRQKLAALDALKKSLLHQAFSGQL